jgi:oligopeptide transport system permease protein
MAEEIVKGTSLWADAWRRLRKNRAATLSAGLLVIITALALGYELFARFVTGFVMEEQHGWVVPKPPGARSVPTHYYSVEKSGVFDFAKVDVNQDGLLDANEVREAYRRYEFSLIDTNQDGKLSYDEYVDAPLSMESSGEFIPTCTQWRMVSKSMAPIEDRSVFDCTAKDGFMAYEDAGKLLELVSSSEALEIVNRFDADNDDAVSQAEYVGLPVPRTHIIGTDQLGRDLLSRTVYGARISLAVGFLATFVSFIIGVSWGATAGYFGGKVDNIMMRIVDIMYGLPFMFLVILLMVVFGQKIFLLFLALGAIQWLTMARIVRGQVISLKNQEFVEAARTIGVSPVGIIFKHLIPNALGPIIVYATLTVPAVMLEEAFLSFLGLGVQAPQTSWGALISEGRQLMESAPWLIVYPGLALAVTLLALNFLGDGLRDALDPQLRKD